MLWSNLIDCAAEFAQELESWPFLARSSQLPPAGADWTVWLLLAGRGFGKARALVEFVLEKIASRTASRVALVAPTAADARCSGRAPERYSRLFAAVVPPDL